MDQRQIQEIIFDLELAKKVLLPKLEEINELLKDETKTKQEKDELYAELDDVEYEIQDIDLDIAMYTEMMDKLFPSEIGACGFPCDGRCQQCGGYDPLYEVFTAGDY